MVGVANVCELRLFKGVALTVVDACRPLSGVAMCASTSLRCI